jgi:hypothetical protein
MELISSGPIRTPAVPAAPKQIFSADGQVIEYLVSCPMHTIDGKDWPPIQITVNGSQINLQRPIHVSTPYQPEMRVGNEAAEAFCTILRLQTPPDTELSAQDGWKIIERLLAWIRIKCRHYWVFHGFTGFGAMYRGTVFTKNGRDLSVQNIASYAPGVVVYPLTEAVWLSIREELENETEIPVSDAIFCDALHSVAARDEVKALLEAGVAVEVAITQLLKDVSSVPPASPARMKFNKNGDRDSFRKKLTEWPQLLGLEQASDFRCPEMHGTWVQTVQELYQLRNAVAHSGTFEPLTSATGVMSLVFAANTLLEYCRVQRSRVGLKSYSMPDGRTPLQQLLSCNNAVLYTNTELLKCLLS